MSSLHRFLDEEALEEYLCLREAIRVEDLPAVLRFASELGRSDIVTRALKEGAEVDQKSGEDGETALYIASRYTSSRDTVQALLDGGADPNLTDNHGLTPLFWAAYHGETAIVQALLKKGADPHLAFPDDTDGSECTPIMVARGRRHTTTETAIQEEIDTRARWSPHRSGWLAAVFGGCLNKERASAETTTPEVQAACTTLVLWRGAPGIPQPPSTTGAVQEPDRT